MAAATSGSAAAQDPSRMIPSNGRVYEQRLFLCDQGDPSRARDIRPVAVGWAGRPRATAAALIWRPVGQAHASDPVLRTRGTLQGGGCFPISPIGHGG
jgi:hypothetical protein